MNKERMEERKDQNRVGEKANINKKENKKQRGDLEN